MSENNSNAADIEAARTATVTALGPHPRLSFGDLGTFHTSCTVRNGNAAETIYTLHSPTNMFGKHWYTRTEVTVHANGARTEHDYREITPADFCPEVLEILWEDYIALRNRLRAAAEERFEAYCTEPAERTERQAEILAEAAQCGIQIFRPMWKIWQPVRRG